jgi:homoserine dehydrogenase
MGTPVLRLGLIGYGTVGRAFARALIESHDRIARRLPARVQLARVAVRRPDRVRDLAPDVRLGDDPLSVALDPSLDLIVEATGDPGAATWLRASLDRGAATISSNKQTIASSVELLGALADRHPLFQCEGAVAAALPIVRALRDSLDGEEILDIRGILNGTTTFVLSEVERGASFHEALGSAVRLGLAEPQATADLSGQDAAAKLAILATIAWRKPVTSDQVHVRGIDARIAEKARLAVENGRRIRLVAEAWHDVALRLLVEPRALDADDPLASVTGVTNAVELHAALAGQLRWFGPGAGGDRTASALLGDVFAAVRARVSGDTAISASTTLRGGKVAA